MSTGGRPLKANLFRDGYEVSAKHIRKQIDGVPRAKFVVTIRPDGGVRSVPSYHYGAAELEALVQRPEYLATYNNAVQINDIENDLIERLRETWPSLAA